MPGPVKIRHKKDGRRIRSHRFHVSRLPSTRALDPLLLILNTHSMCGFKISRGYQSQKWGVILLLPSATKLWQGNVFTPVSHSVHGLSHPRPGHNTLGRHPPGQTPPGRHPSGRHPPMQTPPAQCMLGYTHPCPAQCILGYMFPLAATAADGTHPTGMLSCLNFNFNLFLIPIAWTDPRFPGGSNARCGASIYYLAKVFLGTVRINRMNI